MGMINPIPRISSVTVTKMKPKAGFRGIIRRTSRLGCPGGWQGRASSVFSLYAQEGQWLTRRVISDELNSAELAPCASNKEETVPTRRANRWRLLQLVAAGVSRLIFPLRIAVKSEPAHAGCYFSERLSKLKSACGLLLFIGTMAVPLLSHAGLSFDGVSQYVTFGRATNLGAATFTLETWFNWNGAGVPTTTGSGGTLAIPLIAKLSPEADGDNRDGNYFLGIRPAGALLVADMEEAAT